jgi:hypothetical protein
MPNSLMSLDLELSTLSAYGTGYLEEVKSKDAPRRTVTKFAETAKMAAKTFIYLIPVNCPAVVRI